MFSANENLMLRQHKRRIVDRIEQTMSEEALDLGTTVMVMQVSCKDPGCVPLETAIIIIFPKCGDEELIPGLPESNGGSYKTKILKPMADVKEDDILDNLPPAFEGGRRTMERVCLYARDVMIGQITQLFGDGSEDDGSSVKDRMAMAKYLQSCLQDYIAAGCKPPSYGEPFEGIDSSTSIPNSEDDSNQKSSVDDGTKAQAATKAAATTTIPKTGNIVIRRKVDDDRATKNNQQTSSTYGNGSTTSIRVRQPPRVERAIQQALGQPQIGGTSSTISSLFEREHAPGIRKPGCPCCDPENPSALADSFMMM
jgi:hypothetical protein